MKRAVPDIRPAPVTLSKFGSRPHPASRPRSTSPGSKLSSPTSPGVTRRTLATPEPIKDWSLTSLKEKLIKIGHGRYVAFQMAEVAIPKNLFADILRLIAELRPPPVTSTA